LLKILTVVLAAAGTLALVVASRATARPLTRISAIQPAMNFAYVRVEGALSGQPALSGEDGFLSFRVLDASGELRVSAYRAVVTQLLADGRIPRPGDRVAVEGTLRVRDDEPTLILNTADALTIDTPAARPVRLAAIDALSVGERAQTAGQVRRVREASAALRIVTLRDGSALVDMPLPLDQPSFGEPPALRVGEWVSATGGVGEFRGARQLLPASAAAIVRLPLAPRHAFRPIAALGDSLIGQWVEVEGWVHDLRPFSAGMRVDVRDAAGAAVTAVVFDSIWQALPFSSTLSIDDRIRVQGELTEYRGELEILPELAVDCVRFSPVAAVRAN
jgi:DNA/RNA endonuclease YhcR with UshA esterase domain